MRLGMAALGALPMEWSSRVMGNIWSVVGPRTKRHARVLEHLSAAFPEKSAGERHQIALESWQNMGSVVAEVAHINQIYRQPNRFTLTDNTHRVLADIRDRECIFVTLHAANWELISMTSQMLGYDLAGVYQKLSNPLVDDFTAKIREPYYRLGLFPKGHKTARRLISILKKGGIAAFLADHRDIRGIQVPFFGRPAYCTPVPASLARTLNTPIYAARLIRVGPVKFVLDVEQIPFSPSDDRKQDIIDITARYHAVFEKWIREYPGQWMWIHRKWAHADPE